MMLHNATVNLNHADGIYKPGEVVSGHIRFELEHTMFIQGFYIELCGEARTSYFLGIINCSGQENYIKERYTFISRQTIATHTRLDPGFHIYLFSFTLPDELPDSMTGELGKISYNIQFYLDRRWYTVNNKIVEITVKNAFAQEEPSNDTVNIPFYNNFWFRGGQILGSIKMSTNRHQVGSEIPIMVHITNKSHQLVIRVICKLVRRITYIVSSPVALMRHEDQILNSRAQNYHVRAGQRRVYNVDLEIPANHQITNIRACGIIKITYFIEIIIRIRGCRKNIHKQIPINLYSE